MKHFLQGDAFDFIRYLREHYTDLYSKLPNPINVTAINNQLLITDNPLTIEENKNFNELLEKWLFEEGFIV
jgi:hypothetical protein